jgi:hypothetical protein
MPFWKLPTIGVMRRTPADWYPEKCAVAFSFNQFPNDHNLHVGLYNNSGSGKNFYIYSVDPDFTNQIGALLSTMQGPLGPVDSLARPIVPNVGQPAGEVSHDLTTSIAQPGNPLCYVNPRLTSNPWGGAPLFVLAPGFSLIVGVDIPILLSGTGTDFLIVTFWYMVM